MCKIQISWSSFKSKLPQNSLNYFVMVEFYLWFMLCSSQQAQNWLIIIHYHTHLKKVKWYVNYIKPNCVKTYFLTCSFKNTNLVTHLIKNLPCKCQLDKENLDYLFNSIFPKNSEVKCTTCNTWAWNNKLKAWVLTLP